jgi:hypothetical protein
MKPKDYNKKTGTEPQTFQTIKRNGIESDTERVTGFHQKINGRNEYHNYTFPSYPLLSN